MSSDVFDVFISYRNDSEGKAIGNAIKSSLDARNYSVYFNPDEQKEDYFPDELRNAIMQCKDFVLVITQGCLDRLLKNGEGDWLCKEVILAHAQNKHFVPMLIDGVTPPSREDDWPESLRFLFWANYIMCPKEPERFPLAPLDFLEGKLRSLPEKGDKYRDAFNSNNWYDVVTDFKDNLEAANNGDPEALYEMAIMYFYGFTDENGQSVRNYDKAYQCFKMLSETENEYSVFATNMIGHMYYNGTIPRESQSYEESLKRHLYAAETLDAAAQHAAYMMSIGSGCEFDYDKTVQFFERIAKRSDNSVIFNLAELYCNYGEFAKAASLYQNLYASNIEAAIQLGKLYKRGVLESPPKPNYFMAAHFFQHAIQLGECGPEPYYELGKLYFNPTGAFPKDFNLAQKNFTVAAEMGHKDSQYMLGYMYDAGHVERDYAKAIHYHEMAAKQGHMMSAANLSILYQQPGFVNYQRANRYAKMAANSGMSMGEFLYANLLFFGRGCEADMNEAYMYYKRAYQHGFIQAKMMMEKINRIQKREQADV